MRRLLWKEWQERWLWIALWVLAGVVTTALGKGQRLTDASNIGYSAWMQLVICAALLTGLSGYSSELHGGRATFLYSRAITWKQILAVKLLLGLATVVGACIVNAVAGYLLLPVEYHQLMTTHSLAMGALSMAGFTGAAYLLGLAFSTVLPGVAGAVLTIIGWAAVIISTNIFSAQCQSFSIILILTAPLIAGIMLARFGLTLHSMARVWRFAMVILSLSIIGIVMDYTPPAGMLYKIMNPVGTTARVPYYKISINPDATMAFGMMGPYADLIQLSDGHIHKLAEMNTYDTDVWLGKDILLLANYQPDTNAISCWQWQGKTPRSCRVGDAGSYNLRFSALSPDGNRVLVGGYTKLQLCDLSTGKARALAHADRIKLHLLSHREPTKTHGLYQCWWQTNEVVGYIDPFSGRRVLVEVP